MCMHKDAGAIGGDCTTDTNDNLLHKARRAVTTRNERIAETQLLKNYVCRVRLYTGRFQ